ncbi:MAG: prepilin-type N-terminal cleavage/methylation domain-containing protein, partial [Dehalococcoidia bacterium]
AGRRRCLPGSWGPGSAAIQSIGVGRLRRRERWCDSAFSLLELLVVVALTSLLSAILLPALVQAREEGRASYCAATLHNLGLAAAIYLDDNQGAFWPYFLDLPGPDGGRRWWFGFERGGPPSDANQRYRPLDKAASFLAPYLAGTSQDFRCPSFPYGQGRHFPKFAPSAGGYGYNTGALGGFDQTSPFANRPRRVQEFDGRTADVFILADGIHFDRLDYSSDPPLSQTFNEPAYIQWQDPSLFDGNVGINGGYGHFRHNSRAMVLFLDGHAAGQPPRRPLHPYGRMGYGPVANLSDESLGVRRIIRGNRTIEVDLIYGLE